MKTVTVSADLPPVSCPTCAAKVPAADAGSTETTYLRCPACGDVWNPSRRTTTDSRWTRFGSSSARGR